MFTRNSSYNINGPNHYFDVQLHYGIVNTVGSPIKLFSQTWLIRQSGVAIYRSFASRMTSDAGPVEVSIQTKLQESLKPTHLEVINESNMHNVPKGSESHFKVVVVSMDFENLSLIKRHRMVNDVLKDELAGGVHALSIQAKTPSQWSQNSSVSQSPACLGGMAREMANNKS